jgi:transcriptional regulator with XRE-family HTH domain
LHPVKRTIVAAMGIACRVCFVMSSPRATTNMVHLRVNGHLAIDHIRGHNGPMMLESGEVWDQATGELVRAIRGKRSQVAFSRRLGFRSNVAADWEGGHRAPTADGLLLAMEKVGIDVAAGFDRFHSGSAGAVNEGVAWWLMALAGHTRQSEIARRSGFSRHQVRRWLRGEAMPRVPQFLRLVQALTGRAPDWVAAFVPIDQGPSLEPRYRAGRTAARLAYDHPWSTAVRMLIESEGYRKHPCDAVLLSALGISQDTLAGAIAALVDAGLVIRRRGVIEPLSAFTADVAATDDDTRRVKAHWARVAADRAVDPRSDDLVSFNLVSVSRVDLARMKQLQRDYSRELRGLVAASAPEEVAALVMMQVVTLSAENESS